MGVILLYKWYYDGSVGGHYVFIDHHIKTRFRAYNSCRTGSTALSKDLLRKWMTRSKKAGSYKPQMWEIIKNLKQNRNIFRKRGLNMENNTQQDSDVAVSEKQEIKEPSQYDVIVHNNDHTSYDEVILILSQAFEFDHTHALSIAVKVDKEAKCICGTYSKEIADMKIVVVNMVKDGLIQMFPHRQKEITMLKFTVEKS